MIVSALAALLVPPSLGCLVVGLLWREPAGPSLAVAKAFLGIGLGFGLDSCLGFPWLLAFGPPAVGFLAFECALLAVGVGFWLYRRRSTTVAPTPQTASRFRWDSASIVVAVAFGIVVATAVARWIDLAAGHPNGGGDAWGIWNFHARCIFRGGTGWRDYLRLDHSHPDYPLLLPLSVVRGWGILGRETQAVPAALAAIFTFSTAGLLTSALAASRSPLEGFLGGLVLLGAPFFVHHGASQYADVPLAFFFLATAVLLHHAARAAPPRPVIWALAGLTAGVSAWTKNEGLLLIAVVGLVTAIGRLDGRAWRRPTRPVAWIAAGLLPTLSIVIAFKLMTPPNDLLIGQGLGSSLQRLTDLDRYRQVLTAFVRETFTFPRIRGGVAFSVGFPLLAAIHFIGGGWRRSPRESAGAAAPLGIVGLLLIGYGVAYLTTPRYLPWQLATSLERLFLQIWPTFLFGYFLAFGPPTQETEPDRPRSDEGGLTIP